MGAGGGRAHFPSAGDRCHLPLFYWPLTLACALTSSGLGRGSAGRCFSRQWREHP